MASKCQSILPSAPMSARRCGERSSHYRSRAWKPLRRLTEKGWIEGRKQWAEVQFIPSDASVKKAMKPDRYLAIRVRPWQTERFSDGNSYHYYAVVTNRWEIEGEELLRWQRERCGSVEKIHDVIEERSGGRGNAVREVLRQRGVVAAQLSLLQRDLDDEAQGVAAKLLAGADEGF